MDVVRRMTGSCQGHLGKRYLPVLCWLWRCSWAAYPATGQVAGQVPGFNPEKQFTIVQIDPDAGKEEVRIVFSQPIPLEVIRPKLQLVPPVKINWEKSTVSDEGVLTLRGAFKFGSNYCFEPAGYLHL